MNRPPLRRYFRHGFFPQLVAFEACVRHGSVTRAAEELSLAQPTVSCLVRKLAEPLGEPIPDTRGRRVVPTPLGHELLVRLCTQNEATRPGTGGSRSHDEGTTMTSAIGSTGTAATINYGAMSPATAASPMSGIAPCNSAVG